MEELVPIKTIYGEEKSWDDICELDSADVSKRTSSIFDKSTGAYAIKCFGTEFQVFPCDRKIECHHKEGELFLGKFKDFYRLSVLCYFATSKDIALSGQLIKPTDVKGGHRFSKGTHILPLDKLAERFANDPKGFVCQGQKFGAEKVEGLGDAAIKLYPLPRVPVTLLLWVADEEYPPRVDLFLDSTCDLQIALSDIVWAVAMMSALVMLEE
ncbi:MAG: DUF3786 domain-containing protein [Nitrospira sp.]|nr:DUF3786 domain-containing protein [bacterium]MBL7048344.1 DUF3786 domain-containing protein [Nitrospira sp.]